MRPLRSTRFVLLALIALTVFFVGLVRASADPPPPPPPFVVVVHPSNPQRKLPRKFVGDAFLKKTTRWSNGEVIRPVDLVAESNVREKFSEGVIKRSIAEVKSYWQQIIFSGRDTPPPELSDDDAVLKFVAKNSGAIGYVSGSARLSDVRSVVIE